MDITILDGYLVDFDGLSWEPVSRHGRLSLYPDTPPELIAPRVGRAGAVITNRCPIDEAVLAACPNLRFVGTLGTGYNLIDIEAAARHGVTVCNAPGYSGRSVAQMAVALLLEIACNTARFDRLVKEGGWREAADEAVCAIPVRELAGKTLGILGMGDIGADVAHVALALGMKVLAFRRRPDPAAERDGLRFVSLDELLAGCDVLSVHCPLTDETRGLIDAAALSKMRDGSILINTARGAILDEEAVVSALDSGKLYAVGADVFSREPTGPRHRLACHPRCVATPHVGWASREARERLISLTGQNLGAFLAGTPQNVVR